MDENIGMRNMGQGEREIDGNMQHGEMGIDGTRNMGRED